MEIYTVTQFRKVMHEFFNKEFNDVTYILGKNGAKKVILDLEEYEDLIETCEVYTNPKLRKQIEENEALETNV
jgi:PHD/YefM family antitoxin component YafN of YafNO toxin-antitoxin module